MARPLTFSKSELLTMLAEVFRRSGYDGASMAELSKVTKLSKASLYHHFPGGKAEMATHVMAEEGKRLQQFVLAPLGNLDNPIEALENSLNGVGKFYDGEVPRCLMNSIMLGSGEALFKQGISDAVTAWSKLLANAYEAAGVSADEAQAWSAYALERIQGALIICRVASNRDALEQCLAELQGDVLTEGNA